MTRIIILLVAMVLAAACQSQAVPTLIPTATDLPTETPLPPPTETPTPTATLPVIPQTTAQDPVDQAYARVIHAAPGSPNIDLYIEALAFATNVNFTNLTGQSGIVAGNYTVRVTATGQQPTAENTLVEQQVNILGGQNLIFLVTGTPDALALQVLEEATDPLARGQSRIQLIHAVPRGPDFVVQRDGIALTSNLSFGMSSIPLVLNSEETTLTLGSNGTNLLDMPVNLRERRNYTYVIVGTADDLSSITPIRLETLAPGLTDIQVVNASQSVGLVDLYLGGENISNGLDFGENTETQQITSNSYMVDVYESGADRTTTQPIVSTQLVANPDESITLIVMGDLNSLRVVTYRADLEPTEPNQARVAFINSVPTLSRVNLNAGSQDLSLVYGQVSGEYTFNNTPTSFLWTGETGETFETTENFHLDAGQVYLYVFTARQFGQPLIFSQPVGVTSEPIASDPAILPTAARQATRVRMVNVMESTPFTNFYIDDTLLGGDLGFAASSPLIVIPSGEHVFTVRDIDTDQLLSRGFADFEPGIDYTIVAYGSPDAGYAMTIIPDFEIIPGEGSASIRMLNLSQGESIPPLGIGYSNPNSEIVQPGPDENYRMTRYFGITDLVTETVESGVFSRPARIPAGTYNINILDTSESAIALTLINVPLAANTHYDIAVMQGFETRRVSAYIIPYPQS